MEFIKIESGIGSTSEVEDHITEKPQITFEYGFDSTIRGTRDGKRIFATRWTARPTKNKMQTFEMYSDKNYEAIGEYSTEDDMKIENIIKSSREKFNNYVANEINDGAIKKFDFKPFPEDYRLRLLRDMTQYLESNK